jgi:hypothetical protein
MNYIVTEKQLKFLTENVGLLNEQNQSIVPELAIDTISKIESIYGHMENGKVRYHVFNSLDVYRWRPR